MTLCKVCNINEADKATVHEGTYYSAICDVCHNNLVDGSTVSSGAASYDRSRDAEDHEADMIQPRSGGRPSPEFIRLYPEQAKKMFTPDELDQATRS